MAAPAASSASFLGFNPGSRDPAASSSSRRRLSRCPRNRKKGWKRWGGPEERLGREIGDFLEDVALEQRTAGGLFSEQPDQGLFFVDTGKAGKDRSRKKSREKPLHVDLVLQPDSKIPAPKNILAHQIPNGRKEKRRRRFWEKQAEKGIFPGSERKLRARILRRGVGGGAPPSPTNPPSPKKSLEKGRSDPERNFYDIWAADNPLEQPLMGQDEWFLLQTKKRRVKRPERLRIRPSQAPPVEVIAPGGSYNPTFEDHQALLLQAHQVEVKKEKEEEKVEKQLKIPEGAEISTPETRFQELCQGLLEEDEEEEEPEKREPPKPGTGDAPELPEPGEEEPPKPAAPGKKTEQQRRREKEARALAQRRRREATLRGRRQELFRLRGLRRELRNRELELLGRRKWRRERREQRDQQPRRLGRSRYEAPPLELQLSQELPDSLRTLKPEGSVLLDRFKSFQRRNLIEPRQRAKFKRRYRLKYVEKRAFRQVTL